MKRSLLAATAIMGFSSFASAVELEASGTAGIAPYTIGIALRDVTLTDDLKLEFGITNRAASTGLAYTSDFGPIGRLSTTFRFAYVFDPFRTDSTNASLKPGIRTRLGFKGSVASVGLEANAAYWNVPADGNNPLSIFERDPEPTADDGFAIGANAQYRLSRVLVLSGGAKYSTVGSRLNLKLEGREAESEFTFSGGLLMAFQQTSSSYLGEFGLKYAPADQPYNLNLGVQAGVTNTENSSKFDYGLSFAMDYDLPDELGRVSAFGVWEPWRFDAYQIRYGLGTEFNLGGGVLFARALGGSLGGGLFPWAVQLGFRLPLDDLLKG